MMGIGLPRFPHPVYPVHPCKYLPLSGALSPAALART